MNKRLVGRSIYIASALSNSDLNRRIAEGVSQVGFNYYLPQDDPVNKSEKRDGDAIAVRNKSKIKKCDYLIAVFRQMGIDTSWEVGCAHGLEKTCFLICSDAEVKVAQLSAMLYYSVDSIITVPDWSASPEIISRKIDSAIKKSKS